MKRHLKAYSYGNTNLT